MRKEKILVTSALLYATGDLHFGHVAGAYLPADCYVRAMRLLGHDVCFISGSDEYGVANLLAAEKNGVAPQEWVDRYHARNEKLFADMSIDFDLYGRTSCEGHRQPCQQFFLDLYHNGWIQKRETQRLYSEQEGRFLADRYVQGVCPRCGFSHARGDECLECGASYEAEDLIDPVSKMTQSPLTLRQTTEYVLRLDEMRPKLLKFLETKDWKANVLEFVRHYIQDLKPRSISRDLSWGIPIPLDDAEGKVLYVWFDAPIGYVSITQEYGRRRGDEELWKKYWLDPQTRLVHFIGKDNIPFHAVLFPAMCMGQSLPLTLVDDLPANEFLRLEGKQFSKSEGWTIDLESFLTKVHPDQLRYALAANAPETKDSEFTFEDFFQKCNGDLVGKFGNLAHRTLTFIHKRGLTPKMDTRDEPFLQSVHDKTREVFDHYQNYRLRKACQAIMELAQIGNTFFDQSTPWILIKQEKNLAQVASILWHLLECLKCLALCAFPVLPTKAQELLALLGYPDRFETYGFDSLLDTPYAQTPQMAHLLFAKIEENSLESFRETLFHASQENV